MRLQAGNNLLDGTDRRYGVFSAVSWRGGGASGLHGSRRARFRIPEATATESLHDYRPPVIDSQAYYAGRRTDAGVRLKRILHIRHDASGGGKEC
jgi:hypothetical protein